MNCCFACTYNAIDCAVMSALCSERTPVTVRDCGHLRRFTLEDYDLCLYCEVARLRLERESLIATINRHLKAAAEQAH